MKSPSRLTGTIATTRRSAAPSSTGVKLSRGCHRCVVFVRMTASTHLDMQWRGLRVLVIDDEQSILDAIRMCLRSTGCELHLTTKAEEGLDWARKERPDVIICDVV